MNNKVIAIIPARYGSTRFEGKPLALLGGKTVIEHVINQVKTIIDNVWVATDDERIYNKVVSIGANAIMTSSSHQSGTDRIAEAVDKIGSNYDIVVNIQGDEPFIHQSQIESVLKCFKSQETQIATLGKPFNDLEAALNPNSPKIIVDNKDYAMYFTRALVPYIRNKKQTEWLDSYPYLKHIGLYAYRADVLKEITQLSPSSLEIAESLEQLRWLQNGYKIKIGYTNIETIGIDTPEDLVKAEQLLAQCK